MAFQRASTSFRESRFQIGLQRSLLPQRDKRSASASLQPLKRDSVELAIASDHSWQKIVGSPIRGGYWCLFKSDQVLPYLVSRG